MQTVSPPYPSTCFLHAFSGKRGMAASAAKDAIHIVYKRAHSEKNQLTTVAKELKKG